ncbi:jacalin-like lectin [Streptomyces sp. NBC_01431]|uniref:jacalin-like lectin n=1 Tax=Streptomyces sp. NBC_01431 TaxID=2903863 RepID=UPI003FCEE0D2
MPGPARRPDADLLRRAHYEPRPHAGRWLDDLRLRHPHRPDGWQIAGFHGRADDEVDKIGFIDIRR